MNGAFEQGNTYPYDAQRFGEGYRVIYTPTLEVLAEGLPMNNAYAIAKALRQEMPDPDQRLRRAEYWKHTLA